MTDKQSLRVFVKGNQDLTDTLLDKDSGGRTLDRGLAAKLISDYGNAGRVEIAHEASRGVAAWLAEIEGAEAGGERSALDDFSPDIVITSIEPEVDLLTVPEADATGEFEEAATRLIEHIKQESRAHIFFYNVSSVDRSRHVSNFHGLDQEPVTMRIQRLSLALVHLSNMEGISIIDVDRVVAEIGAAENLDHAGGFSKKACNAIRDEVVRVLDDYGFFDERELVAQVGRRSLKK